MLLIRCFFSSMHVHGRKNKFVFVAVCTENLESPGRLNGYCRKISWYFDTGGLLVDRVQYLWRKQSHPGYRSFWGSETVPAHRGCLTDPSLSDASVTAEPNCLVSTARVQILKVPASSLHFGTGLCPLFGAYQFLLCSRSETWPFLSNPLDTHTPQRENIYIIAGDGLIIRRCKRDTSPAVETVLLYLAYFLPWCSVSNFNYSYICVFDLIWIVHWVMWLIPKTTEAQENSMAAVFWRHVVACWVYF